MKAGLLRDPSSEEPGHSDPALGRCREGFGAARTRGSPLPKKGLLKTCCHLGRSSDATAVCCFSLSASFVTYLTGSLATESSCAPLNSLGSRYASSPLVGRSKTGRFSRFGPCSSLVLPPGVHSVSALPWAPLETERSPGQIKNGADHRRAVHLSSPCP